MKLEVRNLSFAYRGDAVLKDISFDVRQGDFLSVLGSNGVGKTTLFKCILGILTDYGGEILSDGRDLRGMPVKKRAALAAYIPQVNRPAFGYSVLDTVLMGTAGWQPLFSSPRKKETETACEALEQMGILPLAKRDFAELSGGEQQLTLVARALAQRSEILIMDEPTVGMDFGNQFRVLEKVRTLTEQGRTVLFSTHNPQHALAFSNRVLALKDGCVEAFGETRTTLTAELIERLYGIGAKLVECGGGTAVVPLTKRD